MLVTKKILADKLLKYINREIDLQNLIHWAEEMIRESDFEEKDFEFINKMLARIGLADVREFGLTWDDCYNYLHELGYDVKVELSEVS